MKPAMMATSGVTPGRSVAGGAGFSAPRPGPIGVGIGLREPRRILASFASAIWERPHPPASLPSRPWDVSQTPVSFPTGLCEPRPIAIPGELAVATPRHGWIQAQLPSATPHRMWIMKIQKVVAITSFVLNINSSLAN